MQGMHIEMDSNILNKDRGSCWEFSTQCAKFTMTNVRKFEAPISLVTFPIT